MTKMQEKAAELEAKQKALKSILAEAGDERDFSKIKSLGEIPEADKVKKIQEKSKELNDLYDDLKQLQEADNTFKSVEDIGKFLHTPADPQGFIQPDQAGGGQQQKSFGKLFVESKAYKSYKDGGNPRGEFSFSMPTDVKTLFAEGTSWVPQSLRIPGLVIPYATRPIQLLDFIPKGETTMQLIKYMEETTFTNAAAEQSEGLAYPEAALALTERSVTVDKITVTLPITDEQLADVPQAEAYVNQRLPFMIMQRLDYQIQQGNGVAPNLMGILSLPSTQTYTQAGNDTAEDAIYKGMIKVRFTGYASPNLAIIHALDWQTMRLHRTTQGLYIWGDPSQAGPDRIWGIPVALSTSLGQGTAVVGDFANYCMLFERTGLDVQVGYVNDDFIKGRRAIRADTRQAMVWTRPAAFCLVGSLA